MPSARSHQARNSGASLAALAVLSLLISCEKQPDLTTTQSAANEFVIALNAGDEKALLKVMAETALADAKKECEDFKKRPEPKKPAADSMFGTLFYDVEMDRRAQDCTKIPDEFRAILAAAKGGASSIQKIGSPKEEQGKLAFEVQLRPPGWSGDERRVDGVVFVKGDDAKWRATYGFGTVKRTAILNFRHAMPSLAEVWAAKNLEAAIKE